MGNGDIYVGATNNLRRRLISHELGQVTSTKAHLPVTLKSYVAFSGERKVAAFERYLKSGSGHAFANKRLW
ncbi:MAG: GIY-YIG nuclease family protein [Alphaproteobacteria bacterium]